MARLFVGPREHDFFNDISRELMKDIIAQNVYFYSIDYARTLVHDVYAESPEKVFDTPIELSALVAWNQAEQNTGPAGHDEITKLEVHLHTRDLIERRINPMLGDFISYGNAFYEIVTITTADTVFGQVEYQMGVKLECIEAREDQFMSKILGPTWEGYSDPDAVKKTFHQQRGLAVNPEGPTGDSHDLVKKGVLDEPISGAREISTRGGSSNNDSSFYDDA